MPISFNLPDDDRSDYEEEKPHEVEMPLDTFKNLYDMMDEELREDVITLSDLLEVQRRTTSTGEKHTWRMRWCTCSPEDCSLSIYENNKETELVASIFLSGCTVIQVIGGMPPDQAHMIHIDNVTTWSKRLYLQESKCEFHFCCIDKEHAFEWAQRIQANIDYVAQNGVNEMLTNFTVGQGILTNKGPEKAEEKEGSDSDGGVQSGDEVEGSKEAKEEKSDGGEVEKKGCQLLMCGQNTQGQLGLSHNKSQYSTCEIDRFSGFGIKAVALGSSHSLVCTRRHGELLACGENEFGQLGLGTLVRENCPQSVLSMCGRVAKLVCGDSHSLVLTSDDELWSFGINTSGELGLGHDDTVCSPERIDPLSHKRIRLLSAGSHSLVLTSDYDEVFAWGANVFGQLGLGHRAWQLVPMRVDALCRKGVVQIACGQAHTLVLTADDDIFAFGCNNEGQLGLGHRECQETPTRMNILSGKGAKHIACGRVHSVVSGRDIFLFGANQHGQLGLGRTGWTEEYTTSLDSLRTEREQRQQNCDQQLFSIQSNDGHWELDTSLAEAITENICHSVTSQDLRDSKPDGVDDPQLWATVLAVGLLTYGNKHRRDYASGSADAMDVIDSTARAHSWMQERAERVGVNLEDIVNIPDRFYHIRDEGSEVPSPQYTDYEVPQNHTFFRPNTVCQVVCGAYHTFVATENRIDGSIDLYGFGFNAHGQLGLGDDGPRRVRVRDAPTLVPLPAGHAVRGLLVVANGHSSAIVVGSD
jgi:alpha-tubulin suppressor-like RCC1 family protein